MPPLSSGSIEPPAAPSSGVSNRPVTNKPNFSRRLIKGGLAEIVYLWQGLVAWPLAVLVCAATLLLLLAYQVPQDWSYKVGLNSPYDHLYLRSFNPPEPGPGFSFRWSSQESYLRFPGSGRLPHARITIKMQPGGRPADQGLPRVQLWDEQRLLGEVEVRPDRPVYTFDYRPEGNYLQGDLVLTLKVLNSFKDKNHNLPLGVVVTAVELQGGPDSGRPVLPSLPHYAYLLALLVVFYLALYRAGWTATQAAVISTFPALAASLALAYYRFQLTPMVEDLFLHLVLAYPLLVLGLRSTGAWLERRGQAFPLREARWLGLFFALAFVVKAAGLDHPAFATIDHWFRIHQVNRFWDNPAAFWEQYYSVSTGTTVTGQEGGSAVLGQWGVQVSLPYSPLFYIFAAPLSLIWPGHNDPNLLSAVNALASWLETSQLFMLYILLRRAYNAAWSGRAGLIAAGLYGFYPLSFLLFSDGGYNGIFAGWLALLFMTLLADWVRLTAEGQPGRLISFWMVLALAAALLAHTSTLLLMTVFMFLAVLFLLASPSNRATGRKLAVLCGAALALAGLLYYGWYVPGLVSQTLPTLFNKIGSGIGQDNKLLGGRLLGGFWPQLWEHFRLWPFLLAAGFLAYWFLRERLKPGAAPAENIPPLAGPVARHQTVILLAWFATFLLFALLDLKVNLLQKHMLFAAPLLCLGSGLALALAWERPDRPGANLRLRWYRWAVGAAIAGLLLFNFVQGLVVWYSRVYYLVYQPGSG